MGIQFLGFELLFLMFVVDNGNIIGITPAVFEGINVGCNESELQ